MPAHPECPALVQPRASLTATMAKMTKKKECCDSGGRYANPAEASRGVSSMEVPQQLLSVTVSKVIPFSTWQGIQRGVEWREGRGTAYGK